MFDGAHLRERCDHNATVSRTLGDAPRIVSEAGGSSPPPIHNLRRPNDLTVQPKGVRGNTAFAAPGKGVDATVTPPDE